MKLQVAKWGNSLALRIPADIVRSIGIKEGDSLEACLSVEGGLTIRPATWNRQSFAHELMEARQAMPLGQAVMDEVRRTGSF